MDRSWIMDARDIHSFRLGNIVLVLLHFESGQTLRSTPRMKLSLGQDHESFSIGLLLPSATGFNFLLLSSALDFAFLPLIANRTDRSLCLFFLPFDLNTIRPSELHLATSLVTSRGTRWRRRSTAYQL